MLLKKGEEKITLGQLKIEGRKKTPWKNKRRNDENKSKKQFEHEYEFKYELHRINDVFCQQIKRRSSTLTVNVRWGPSLFLSFTEIWTFNLKLQVRSFFLNLRFDKINPKRLSTHI